MPRARTTDSAPLFPFQQRIAAQLAADPALLGLRTRRLVPDVMQRLGVSCSQARVAVAAARRMVAP